MARRDRGGAIRARARSVAYVAAVQDQPAEHRQQKCDQPVDAERFHGAAGRVPEEVGEQPDAGRPADAAERVPHEERPPAHARGARQPRRPDAQAEQEAPEEHRLGPVGLEERLADSQHLLALTGERAGALQQPAPAPAADLIADVVADDRRGGGDRDHERDLQLALAGEHGGGDQRGLARDRKPAGLAHHEHEQQRVAERLDKVVDVEDRGQQGWALYWVFSETSCLSSADAFCTSE